MSNSNLHGIPGNKYPGASTVFVAYGNGHGSAGTAIRRFTTILANIGSSIKYTDSITEGASFRINHEGVYMVVYSDGATGTGNNYGISINAPVLSDSINAVPDSRRVAIAVNAVASGSYCFPIVYCGYLHAGDIVRPHTDAGLNSVAFQCNFLITKIS